MSEFQEKSTITHREELTPEVIRLTVTAPKISAAAKPGQFVMVRISEGLDPLLRRPFSIHRVNPDGTLSILFKIIGKGTRLMAAMKPGTGLSLIGPLGKGFNLHPEGSFCMIGGGMGIAPLYFLAQIFRQSEYRENNQPVLLGSQTQAELLLLAEEFTELGYSVLTATDDGSLGHQGFITELLDEILLKIKQVYVCGPMPMMRTVALKCRDAGVDCQVSLETHMACGLGACLGCNFPAADGGYKHVCKDGPVLSADEVIWPL
ncbi:MAG TPA: dihydroorotate dehydrogenase electron transfer subunit [Desulfobacteraceae bacterium]|nr:dihydroorotate dehydrogenase electron transfer subunit [Desulfobacteraceae bacterium]